MRSAGLYRRVRQAYYREGKGIRELSRDTGLHRDTIRKMLLFSIPPGYRRKEPPKKPKLDPFTGVIDAILGDDANRPRKQRHTARPIFDQLCDEHGFTGGNTIVKDYVRSKCQSFREMFIPLSHPPGHGQIDFGEALAVIDGVEKKVHYFVMSLPHSDGMFVKAYPAETTEAFRVFHSKSAGDFTLNRPPVSLETGHLFQGKPATHFTANRPPLGGPWASGAREP